MRQYVIGRTSPRLQMSIDPTRSTTTQCHIPEERKLSADPISYSRRLVARVTKIFRVASNVFSIFKQKYVFNFSFT